MNLLCPLCQKMLAVEEKYAGQMMKCPLCGGTFTVPGLPGAPAVPPAPAAPAAPPAPPEVYPVQAAAEPAPGAGPAPAVEPARVTPSPTPEPVSAPPARPAIAGYLKVFSITFSPQVLQYFAPVAVVLIFVLQIFSPWVGVYPGGVAAATQNAWQATFGGYSQKPDLSRFFHIPDEAELSKNKDKEDKDKLKDISPSFSFLMFVYLFLFLVTLVLTVGCFVLPFLQVRLPPAVEKLWPWRWGIVAAANLIVFLFLAIQLFASFGLEDSADKWAQEQAAKRELGQKPQDKPPELQLLAEKGRDKETARTVGLRLVVVLHLVAIAGAALMFWIGQRGNRPLPRIDVLW
jgi:hypothetical protein